MKEQIAIQNKIEVVGIDLAKNNFQICCADARGKILKEHLVRRKDLLAIMAQLPPSLVAMEACGGAHYWARQCQKLQHKVLLIPPQYIKPFVRTNKNDRADAEAIVTAALQPNMPFVPVKQESQQEIMTIHRLRSILVKHRTSLINNIRGLLAEFGMVFPQGFASVRRGLADILSPTNESLPNSLKTAFSEIFHELLQLDQRITIYDTQLHANVRTSESCRRLMTIPGIGVMTSTALVGTIGDWKRFSNGRALSAYLGLVPRQHSSGGSHRLLGISKRGDKYLRSLIVHGARSVLWYSKRKSDRFSQWACACKEKRGFNRACVAVANKLARRCWAIMVHNTKYQEAFIS
jgi:transposase